MMNLTLPVEGNEVLGAAFCATLPVSLRASHAAQKAARAELATRLDEVRKGSRVRRDLLAKVETSQQETAQKQQRLKDLLAQLAQQGDPARCDPLYAELDRLRQDIANQAKNESRWNAQLADLANQPAHAADPSLTPAERIELKAALRSEVGSWCADRRAKLAAAQKAVEDALKPHLELLLAAAAAEVVAANEVQVLRG